MFNIKVKVKSGTIGPAHDPYSWDVVYVENETTHRAAELYTDGLMGCKFKLFDEHGRNVREIRWFSDQAKGRTTELKANLLARRWVGTRFDDAHQDWFDNTACLHVPSYCNDWR